jgi:hypothetical protein
MSDIRWAVPDIQYYNNTAAPSTRSLTLNTSYVATIFYAPTATTITELRVYFGAVASMTGGKVRIGLMSVDGTGAPSLTWLNNGTSDVYVELDYTVLPSNTWYTANIPDYTCTAGQAIAIIVKAEDATGSPFGGTVPVGSTISGVLAGSNGPSVGYRTTGALTYEATPTPCMYYRDATRAYLVPFESLSSAIQFSGNLSASFTNASATITVTNGYANGNQIVLDANVGTNFTAGTTYFVVNRTATTIGLAATSGGTAITSNATATANLAVQNRMVGVLFSMPFPSSTTYKVIGARWNVRIANDRLFDMVLYDTSGTNLQSASNLDSGIAPKSNATSSYYQATYYFDTTLATLTGGTQYRLVLRGVDSLPPVNLHVSNVPSDLDRKGVVGTDMKYEWTTNVQFTAGSGWVETLTIVPGVQLIISDVTAGSTSGGGYTANFNQGFGG